MEVVLHRKGSVEKIKCEKYIIRLWKTWCSPICGGQKVVVWKFDICFFWMQVSLLLSTDRQTCMLALCGLSVIMCNHSNRRDNWSHRQFLEINMFVKLAVQNYIFNKIQDCWNDLRSRFIFHFLIIFAPLWWLYWKCYFKKTQSPIFGISYAEWKAA